MTEPTDVFVHIFPVKENRFGMARLDLGGDHNGITAQLDITEYDDYLNVMARYRYWQARLGKVAAEA